MFVYQIFFWQINFSVFKYYIIQSKFKGQQKVSSLLLPLIFPSSLLPFFHHLRLQTNWAPSFLIHRDILSLIVREIEASRGAAHKRVTVNVTGCGFDPHSKELNIYLNLHFYFFALVFRQSAALSSATQHAMSPKFTQLCAGFSVKLIIKLNLLLPFIQYKNAQLSIRSYHRLLCIIGNSIITKVMKEAI